jgi:hypothetical protein
MVAVHAVLDPEVNDLAPDGGGDVAQDPDPELLPMSLAAVSLADVDAAGLLPVRRSRSATTGASV